MEVTHTRRGFGHRLWLVSLLCLVIVPAEAAFVKFSNCLSTNVIRSSPRILQFVPLHVTAFFDTVNPSHNLNVTFYGNVTGQSTSGPYPPPSDPRWTNPDETFGKIPNIEPLSTLRTTLFNSIHLLTYTPYTADRQGFCDAVQHVRCPVAPSFNVSGDDLTQLPAWNLTYDLLGSYAFSELVVTGQVRSGSESAEYYACINAFITPDIGNLLRALLRYLPMGILVLVAVATISAAIFSPWGTWDIFRWTSNFGRDEDVLRLVTPGFGDCLQYLQFIVLSGSLSLNYPGFYQPVVSRVGWSSLLFNESFVSRGNGSNPLVDGVYAYRNFNDSGMDRMTQLIGMSLPADAWADMMVWLVVIVAAVALLTQIGFILRWAYRVVMNIPPEDLRSKNWYFTIGNAIRVTIGFFILPIISLSMYQFTIADRSPIYITVLAAVVLVAIIAFSVRLVFLFARTRPRSYLFDDIQTVLAYGPLYNTYCDDAATFGLIPILVNFLRGIAIGAVQVSGVAQIVLLAISEIVFVLTINAFRPYPANTSMNLYHTCFSVLRVIAVLLSVAFVPSLNVNGGSRGWIGYVILLIHACVLVFGFFLNAVQTLIEVVARLAGAGGSGGTDAARGGLAKVFGVRQLSKRMPRGDNVSHHSLGSNTGMLNIMDDNKDAHMSRARSRSVSLTSTMLLENNMRSPRQESQMYANTSDGQITPDAASTFSARMPRRSGTGVTGGIIGLTKQVEAKDPYYRPPRRNTTELLMGSERQSLQSNGNVHPTGISEPGEDRVENAATPFKMEDFEDPPNELTKAKTDYAVREVDFYYGVRGPALSSGTRKLKTGPADPTGPVSSATGWFKGLMGGRQKEKTKGFEVVRSARAPPARLVPVSDAGPGSERAMAEPYRDIPLEEGPSSSRRPHVVSTQPEHAKLVNRFPSDSDEDPLSAGTVPAEPPLLPLIDTGGGIELPSRVGSTYSKNSKAQKIPPNIAIPEVPELPRRSSRRTSSVDSTKAMAQLRLSIAGPSSLAASTDQPGDGELVYHPVTSAAARQGPSHEIIIPSSHDDGTITDDQAYHADDDQIRIPYAGRIRSANAALTHGLELDRPESVGRVREHRASDAITHQSATAVAEEKSAEIHGGDHTPNQSWNIAGNRSSSIVNPYGQPGQRSSRFRD